MPGRYRVVRDDGLCRLYGTYTEAGRTRFDHRPASPAGHSVEELRADLAAMLAALALPVVDHESVTLARLMRAPRGRGS